MSHSDNRQHATKQPRSEAQREVALRLARAGTVGRQRRGLINTTLPKLAATPPEVWTPETLATLSEILQNALPAGFRVRIEQDA